MAEDNMRARLTKELTAEKERALAKQKEEYEEKLQAMKEKDQDSEKKNLPKLSPLELLKKQEKDKAELRDYKRRSYYSTRTGKVGKKLEFLGRLREQGYRAAYTDPRRIKLARLRSARRPRLTYQQQLMLEARRRGWNPQDLDASAWDDFFISRMLEREVSGNSNIGRSQAWDGARAANDVNREAALFGNLINPTRRVNAEAFLNAKAIDINPSLIVDREVNAFANILNPNYKRTRPVRRRRRR